MRRRDIVLFCLIAYAVSWSLQFAAIARFGNPDTPAAAPYLVGAMFAPALAALLIVAFRRDARRRLLWRPTWRMVPYLVVAFVVPTLVAFGTMAVVMAVHWGAPGGFVFAPHGVTISGGPWLLGRGAQTWPVFIGNVFLTGGAFAAFNALAAMGEELGWRGLLQGALTERLGVGRGIALLGLIWSFWHLPGLLAGYNYPEHPVLGAFVLFPVVLIGASFFAGWLTIRSGSFWPAAIAHGAVNSIEEGVTSNLHMTAPHLFEDLTRLAFTLAFGLVFWRLLARRQSLLPSAIVAPGGSTVVSP